jgi:hypothetical protein
LNLKKEADPPVPFLHREERTAIRDERKEVSLKGQEEKVDKKVQAKMAKIASNKDEGDDDDMGPSAFGRLADAMVTPLPPLPQPGPDRLPPTGYFICASDKAVISDINVLSLKSDDLLDRFFQDLHFGLMAFEDVPNANGVKLLSKTDFTDELCNWFVKALGAHSVTAKRIEGASLSALSIEFSVPFQMSFSTEAMYTALHWKLPLLPPCSYLVSQGSMIFGLAAAPGANPSLGGVLNFLGLPGDHLLALDTEAKLVLDTAPASRNAIWFTPWDNYETVLRLQFTLVDESILTSFIKTISPKLNFSKPKVIVRRRLTWFRNSGGFEYMIDPQIIFAVSVTRTGGSAIETIFTFERGVVTIIMRPSDGILLDFLGWMADLAGADSGEVKQIDNWVNRVSKKLPKVLELKIQATAAGLQAFFVVMELEVEFGKRNGQSENAAFLVSGRRCSFLLS